MRTFAVAVLAISMAAGCRAHPCGDRSADLPSAFGDAPIVQEEGRICYAQQEQAEATVMYWGGKSRMNEVVVQTIVRMNQAGWEQQPAPHHAPAPDAERPRITFRKGNQRIHAWFEVSKTPRFGAKLEADSVRVALHHSVVSPK
jgi:hypothetical protein